MAAIPTYTHDSKGERQLEYLDSALMSEAFWAIKKAISDAIVTEKEKHPNLSHEEICRMAHLCATSWLMNA